MNIHQKMLGSVVLFAALCWSVPVAAQNFAGTQDAPEPATETSVSEAAEPGMVAISDEEMDEIEQIVIKDPYESYNRFMFSFNDKLYTYFLKHVAKGYDFVVPTGAQKGIRKFFTNIRMPIRFFNCAFQGKFRGANIEASRFLINSTVGLGGFFDPAKYYFNLQKQDEDFGQTLGKHGMKEGFYIVWPFFGPSNVRDTIGFIGDVALNPLTYVSLYAEPEEIGKGLGVLNYTNELALDVGDNYESIKRSAVDPYIAIQDAYVQNRAKRIKR